MTLDRSQIKKGGQLAGMPKFLWLVLFFVVTLCCCRMSYWSGMKLKRKAEAQGLPTVSLMPEGCRDQAAKIAVGATTGPIWGQTTSGNRRTLFPTAKNQEIKSSPLHESNKSVRTHGLRHHPCRLLLDQTSYPIQQGHLAPGLVRGQGQASGNYWKNKFESKETNPINQQQHNKPTKNQNKSTDATG